MILLIIIAAVGFTVNTASVVVAAATIRALLYAVPLAVFMTLYRGRQYVLMKLALAAYALTALASAFGASRDLASLLSIAPASLLALAIVTWSTRPIEHA